VTEKGKKKEKSSKTQGKRREWVTHSEKQFRSTDREGGEEQKGKGKKGTGFHRRERKKNTLKTSATGDKLKKRPKREANIKKEKGGNK